MTTTTVQSVSPIAMCIGRVGCRFGNGDTSAAVPDRQLVAAFRSAPVDLIGSDMHGARFSNNLTDARLAMTNLRGAVFATAQLDGANFVDADLSDADFSADLPARLGTFVRSMKRAQFSYSMMYGVVISRADLAGARFIGANLTSATIQNSNVTGADFTGAHLDRISTYGLTGTPVLPAGWRLVAGRLVGPGAFLADSRQLSLLEDSLDQFGGLASINQFPIATGSTCPKLWNGAVPWVQRLNSYQSIRGADNVIGRQNFSGADLQEAVFAGFDLRGADFTRAKLRGAQFTGANLAGARFTGADLTGVNLTGAYLEATDFTDATVKDLRTLCTYADVATMRSLPGYRYVAKDANVRVMPVNGTITTTQPRRIRSGIIFGPDVNLTGLNFAGFDMGGVSLAGAQMGDVNSATVDGLPVVRPTLFQGAARWPAGWRVENGILVGPGADLSKADLRGLSFSGSFEDVKLDGVKSAKTKIAAASTLPTGWTLANGYLVGRGVALSGVQFAGQTFKGTDFSGSDFTKCSFDAATFDHVRGVDVTGNPRMPKGWIVSGGVFVGPSADLSGREISFANEKSMGSIDLSNATLSGSTLGDFPVPPRLPAGYTYVPNSQSPRAGIVVGPDVELGRVPITGSPGVLQALKLPDGWAVAGTLTGAVLLGPGVELRNSTALRGATTGLDLSQTDLGTTSISGLSLTGAHGIKVTAGPNSLPRGWKIVGTFGLLAGPGADMTDYDLTGADLTGLDLSGATMTGAHGRFVKTGPGTRLPAGWGVVNNFLVGPGADLSHALIVGADLTGISLEGARFADTVIFNVRGSNDKNLWDGTLVTEGADVVCSPYGDVSGMRTDRIKATISQLGTNRDEQFSEPRDICRLNG